MLWVVELVGEGRFGVYTAGFKYHCRPCGQHPEHPHTVKLSYMTVAESCLPERGSRSIAEMHVWIQPDPQY